MELNHKLLYSASKSRDPRFDGRFFMAVLTTGIYCRPVCPAIMPKSENVRFYISASAARDAGFRPCLRCRPEASPGTPDWQGTSALVARGMHLIDKGILDGGSVDKLSNQLNIGTRQLRRLFVDHLGASPIRIAQTRRLHFAKKLIDETDLPMSEVAFASGYSSIRRFNDVLRQTYDRTPSELRYRRKRKSANGDDGNLRLTLSYRPPYDWQASHQFLKKRAIPGVEHIQDGIYQRTIRIGEEQGVIKISHNEDKGHLLLAIPPNLSTHVLKISERVRSLFDLRADPMPIAEHLKSDSLLRPLVEGKPGFRIPRAWDAFEIGVRAILGQQISVKAANTLAGRLVKAHGELLPDLEDVEPNALFPTPAILAEAPLQTIGLTFKRAETIRLFAREVLENEMLLRATISLEDSVEQLKNIPGIGTWTAHYIAMRGLGEPDAFPAGDLALQRAAAQNGQSRLSERELWAKSQGWRPWRAYAAFYLWQHYSSQQNEGTTK